MDFPQVGCRPCLLNILFEFEFFLLQAVSISVHNLDTQNSLHFKKVVGNLAISFIPLSEELDHDKSVLSDV